MERASSRTLYIHMVAAPRNPFSPKKEAEKNEVLTSTRISNQFRGL